MNLERKGGILDCTSRVIGVCWSRLLSLDSEIQDSDSTQEVPKPLYSVIFFLLSEKSGYLGKTLYYGRFCQQMPFPSFIFARIFPNFFWQPLGF